MLVMFLVPVRVSVSGKCLVQILVEAQVQQSRIQQKILMKYYLQGRQIIILVPRISTIRHMVSLVTVWL
jgi:primosomal protein N'